MGEFLDLTLDLVHHVDKSLAFVDKVRIRAVSSSLNSSLPLIPKLQSKHLPWMLLQDNTKGASIYSVHEPGTYPLDLPEIKNKIFKGSSYGWIVTLDDTDGSIEDIYLFNPLTRDQIQLPPRSSFPDIEECNPDWVGGEYLFTDTTTPQNGFRDVFYFASKGKVNQNFTEKVVLSSPPTSDDCTAVDIFGQFGQLARCRLDDKKWTPFKEYSSEPPQTGISDVVFHDGKLHALYHNGKLVVYDNIDPEASFTEVVTQVSGEVTLTTPMYLVQCRNLGILMAARYIDHCDEDDLESSLETDFFTLYKLVDSSMNDGSKDWIEIERIGKHMFFLGLNLSLSIPVSDELKSLGYKSNCIYFTDKSRDFCDKTLGEEQENSDIGLWELEDEATDVLPNFDCDVLLFWPPPIWVTPSAN